MKAKHILITACLILLLGLGSLWAQNAASDVAPAVGDTTLNTDEAEPAGRVTLGSIIRDSNERGRFGYMILLFFLGGVGYAFIRGRQLFIKERINAANLYKGLKGYLRNNQIDEAITIVDKLKHSSLGHIYFSALHVYQEKREASERDVLEKEIKAAIDEGYLQNVYKLDANLFWFDALAQICTWLGLLGTIWGLLYAFDALNNVADREKNTLLTTGIKTAIGTTALGLMAAIFLTIIKGALHTKAQKIINEIDEYSVKLMNILTTKS